MKAQYVGDIGDFGKVLLLKHLAGLGFKIGVNWMMTRNDGGPDGIHRGYVNYTGVHSLHCCDAELLADILPLAEKPVNERSIDDLEAVVRVFSPNALFFKAYFDDFGMRKERSDEADKALNHSVTDLVFFDPDNGLSDGYPSSAKHIYLNELTNYWGSGKSLLVYHHLPQRQLAEAAISTWTSRLEDIGCDCVRHFRFRRGTGRVYFLCIQPDHVSRMPERNDKFGFSPLLVTKKDWARLRRLSGVA